ncbi:uncharacterized protein VTP21DRAFT_4840 [Calcarisporiella thermophila]|uniref:uncharacterized protein n=1 Tax=Calcarisporiella thermophila TaxID=911321 RepID=UPI0037429D54
MSRVRNGDHDGILENDENQPYTPPHQHHRFTRSELIKNLANRIVYSRFYVLFYLFLTVVCLATLVLFFFEGCATPLLVTLEVFINTALCIEISLRWMAVGRRYWSSIYNLFDVLVFFACVITLALLIAGRCSKAEEVVDVIAVGVRNVVQVVRLAVIFHRNRRNLAVRRAGVEFLSVEDDDLGEEGLLAWGNNPAQSLLFVLHPQWSNEHQCLSSIYLNSPSSYSGAGCSMRTAHGLKAALSTLTHANQYATGHVCVWTCSRDGWAETAKTKSASPPSTSTNTLGSSSQMHNCGPNMGPLDLGGPSAHFSISSMYSLIAKSFSKKKRRVVLGDSFSAPNSTA